MHEFRLQRISCFVLITILMSFSITNNLKKTNPSTQSLAPLANSWKISKALGEILISIANIFSTFCNDFLITGIDAGIYK